VYQRVQWTTQTLVPSQAPCLRWVLRQDHVHGSTHGVYFGGPKPSAGNQLGGTQTQSSTSPNPILIVLLSLGVIPKRQFQFNSRIQSLRKTSRQGELCLPLMGVGSKEATKPSLVALSDLKKDI
jgi:hypothetical protein